ncbi:helix-turn-helix transcriptional regulator [Microvirga sp. W0021]|uniref:Helix-turn-helix transcriptional regulator n=1 Tax=Hohaiivirga grylli TaxID=3133970 RepID=A0ABV0BF00_9HYPH
MKQKTATTIFESLSSSIRLDIFRLLVKKGYSGLVAGEISTSLGIAPNNLSFHLKALTQAGLLTVEQEGRYQRYRADINLMQDLITYLTDECCSEDICTQSADTPSNICVQTFSKNKS